MAKHTVPNDWSLAELVTAFGPLPRAHEWRVLGMAVVGAINGLPGSTGTAVATNGVLVAIVQPRGLFIGHLASFVAYDDGVVVEKTGKVKKKETKTKAKTSIEEFV